MHALHLTIDINCTAAVKKGAALKSLGGKVVNSKMEAKKWLQ